MHAQSWVSVWIKKVLRCTQQRCLLLCAFFYAQLASAAGVDLPWNGPLEKLQQNLTGPTAKTIGILLIALTGLMWAFSDHGSGLKNVLKIAFGISLAINAVTFGSTLFGWS